MMINKEIETLINNLEGCIGMFDYMLTPIESNLLLAYIKELQQENKELHKKIDKIIELNNQIIKDTKSFYRPTSDTIYSGDCLIDIAKQNLKILKGSDVDE